MAEASKPAAAKTSKQKPVKLAIQEDESNSKEINDKNLEKRLKSLTSFINNIEPEPKEVSNPVKVTTFIFHTIF